MSNVQDIEMAIRRLSHDDLASLRAWLASYDAEAWDQEIATDATSGRLDAFYRKMRREDEGEPTTPLAEFLDARNG